MKLDLEAENKRLTELLQPLLDDAYAGGYHEVCTELGVKPPATATSLNWRQVELPPVNDFVRNGLASSDNSAQLDDLFARAAQESETWSALAQSAAHLAGRKAALAEICTPALDPAVTAADTEALVLSTCEIALDDLTLELGGKKFKPDATKAYCEFVMSHSWPVVTFYGEALHPAAIAASYESLLHQPVNFGHQLRSYDAEKIFRDRILGSVVGVEFAGRPSPTGWKLPGTVAEAPGIRAVASLFKAADGADRIIGKHQTGRKPYTVSMEVSYANPESGFMVQATPGTIAPGWDYIPLSGATESLRATRDWKQLRMATKRSSGGYHGEWKDAGGTREVFWLMGGLTGQNNHYKGVGIVEAGAEPTAEIVQMLAAREADWPEVAEAIGVALKNLENQVKKTLTAPPGSR